MPLEFQNHYHNKIWIALVYGDNCCGPTYSGSKEGVRSNPVRPVMSETSICRG
jgi:hypothetical protein